MKGTTKSKGIGIAAITALFAALLIAAVIAPAMAGEEGTPPTPIDGGYLIVNETGGACTAVAVDHDLEYVPGRTYKIMTQYTYIDAPGVCGGTAYFKLAGPDGKTTTKSIFDCPVEDNSDEGILSVLWSPSGPGEYEYTIYCGGATDTGGIKLT